MKQSCYKQLPAADKDDAGMLKLCGGEAESDCFRAPAPSCNMQAGMCACCSDDVLLYALGMLDVGVNACRLNELQEVCNNLVCNGAHYQPLSCP
jgi:hypothetical protein